jgi:alpha-galactosidase
MISATISLPFEAPAIDRLLKPKLNAARVFGVRPKSPALFNLAVTGERPLRFEAENLPAGLVLDMTLGRITGSLPEPGRHYVRVRISNSHGEVYELIRIECGPRIALTPPMGWNSWNCWAGSVTAGKVISSARALVDGGLTQHGWSYVNIDDGWQGRRREPSLALQPNEHFPDMGDLCDELHELGLKVGIYSTPWVMSYAGRCGGSSDHPDGRFQPPESPHWHDLSKGQYQGLRDFSVQDASQWAQWGVDYLKYDWFPNDRTAMTRMSAALRHSGRDIVYSLSNTLHPGLGPDAVVHANAWRTTNDIQDCWSTGAGMEGGHQGLLEIIRQHSSWSRLQSPGAWNDPDMLVLGQLGWGKKLRPTRLTNDEKITHFALWCLWSAPLLIGCPVDQLDPFTHGLLTHEELIALNQDPLGRQAAVCHRDGDRWVFVKELFNGDRAVGLVNLGETPTDMVAAWKHLNIQGTWSARDVYARRDLGDCSDEIGGNVSVHGILVFRLTREESGRDGETCGCGP